MKGKQIGAAVLLAATLALGAAPWAQAAMPRLDLTPMEEPAQAQAQDDAALQTEPEAEKPPTSSANTPPSDQDAAETEGGIVGRLWLPGTELDETVVQGPDNMYYMRRDTNGRYDYNGSAFADYRASFGGGSRRELSRNTVIYRLSDNDAPYMGGFNLLKQYTDPDFAKDNPYIYFATEREEMVWEVFAVFYATVDLPYNNPQLEGDQYAGVMAQIAEASLYRYEGPFPPREKILTLSTNDYSHSTQQYNDYRFVVMARLVEPGAARKETARFEINPAPEVADEMVW